LKSRVSSAPPNGDQRLDADRADPTPSPQPPAPSAWGVFLITDRAQTNGRPLLEVVDAALQGGIRAVQLRERDLSTRGLLGLAEQLRALTRRAGAALLINDRIDVALACDADGVHLPGNSFAVADARAVLGPQRLIGVSTHAAAEAAAAAQSGADYVLLGPIYDTPSKRAYGAPLGVAALAEARSLTRLPLFAIGGIDPDTVRQLSADGIAVIRAIMSAVDPQRAAQALLESFSPQRNTEDH